MAWTSYDEAAKAGFSNIATQNEWARRNKMGYGSYQDYLNAMYSKYVDKNSTPTAVDGAGGGSPSSPSATTTSTTPTTQTPQPTQTSQPTSGGGFSAKYRGDSFTDWYKANFGSDYDPNSGSPSFSGLSDIDSAIGQNLFNYYQLQQQAEANKASGLSELEKWYASQNQSNEESYNKYLSQLEELYGKNKESAEQNYSGQAGAISDEYSAYLEKIRKQYDSQVEQLNARFGGATEALDKSKTNSQQNASITLDKLKKYLPTQIKAQGLVGLGVSESTMLQAYNNYNNQMGKIASDYNTNKSALESNFNESKASYDNSYNDSVSTIGTEQTKKLADIEAQKNSTLASLLDEYYKNKSQAELDKMSGSSEAKSKYDSQMAALLQNYSDSIADYKLSAGQGSQSLFDAYKTKYEAQQEQLRQEQLAKEQYERENAYIVAQATVEDLIASGEYDKAISYLEANKNTFGDEVYNTYISQITPKKQAAETEKAETEQAEKDTRILEGKEYVSYNGGNYQIKSQLNGDSNEIKRNNDFKKQLQEKFGISNPYDSNIPNGTTLAIKADNRGSNDFNFWDDIGAFLLSPLGAGAWDSWGNWNTVYVTYYNGNWYKSEKK